MSPVFTSPAKKRGKKENTTAIGVTQYKKLVAGSTVFIDKSLLIKEFLESASETTLIACPRRWGKSINLDMIKTFLEIQLDEEGKPYEDRKKTSHYKLFAEGEIDFGGRRSTALEERLLISKHKNIIGQYQGQYPVILIDFKNAKGNSYREIVNGVKTALHNTFMQHEKLYKALLKEEINDYNEINETSYPTDGKNIKVLTKIITSKNIPLSDDLLKFKRLYDNDGQGATEEDIKTGLKFLSELLHTHFGKRVYVLMDEYDAPISHASRAEEFPSGDLSKILTLFGGILGSVFKESPGEEPFLEKGLITGVFRTAKAGIFSDLNNLREYNSLTNKFAKYYGFSQSEVKELFSEYQILPELSKQAQDWYDGYRVISDKELQIYNPWSIVNFLDGYNQYPLEEKHLAIQNYWEESGNIDFIKNLFKIPEIREKIQSLINNEEDVLINLRDLKFTQDDFLTLKTLLNVGDNYKIYPGSVDLFFSYIFAAGYLTINEKQDYGRLSAVRLPNKEIASEFEKKLIDYYEQTYRIDHGLFLDVTDQLNALFSNNNTYKLKEAFEKLLGHREFPEFINLKQDIGNGVHGNEAAVHAVLFYIALQVKNLSKLGTEVWYKNKFRVDIALVDKKESVGMIIELKYANSAAEAMDQIERGEYDRIFEKYTNLQKIKHVGVNVGQDKRVDIECALVNNYQPPSQSLQPVDAIPLAAVENIAKSSYNLRSEGKCLRN